MPLLIVVGVVLMLFGGGGNTASSGVGALLLPMVQRLLPLILLAFVWVYSGLIEDSSKKSVGAGASSIVNQTGKSLQTIGNAVDPDATTENTDVLTRSGAINVVGLPIIRRVFPPFFLIGIALTIFGFMGTLSPLMLTFANWLFGIVLIVAGVVDFETVAKPIVGGEANLQKLEQAVSDMRNKTINEVTAKFHRWAGTDPARPIGDVAEFYPRTAIQLYEIVDPGKETQEFCAMPDMVIPAGMTLRTEYLLRNISVVSVGKSYLRILHPMKDERANLWVKEPAENCVTKDTKAARWLGIPLNAR
jgi:hypothetical protein